MSLDATGQGASAPSLTDQERAKYVATWKHEGYRTHSPGERHLRDALAWMQPRPESTITDWGCGTGRASFHMARMGYRMRLVDIASNAYVGALPFVEACLWELPADLEPTDYGYCADVMEHLPTEKVDDVLAGISARTRDACYFQIALFHDRFGKVVKMDLHLTVMPAEWWHEKVRAHFKSAEFKGLGSKHCLAIARNAG